jgi:hypothetical protein
MGMFFWVLGGLAAFAVAEPLLSRVMGWNEAEPADTQFTPQSRRPLAEAPSAPAASRVVPLVGRMAVDYWSDFNNIHAMKSHEEKERFIKSLMKSRNINRDQAIQLEVDGYRYARDRNLDGYC